MSTSFCLFQKKFNDKLLFLLIHIVSLSISGSLGSDTMQTLVCTSLSDGLESLEVLEFISNCHGSGSLDNLLDWHNISSKLERLNTLVPSAVINSNTNGLSVVLAQSSSLQFLKSESSTSSDLDIVFVGWTVDHWSQLSKRS